MYECSLPRFLSQKRRKQQQEDGHPLEGSLKKRMRLFAGGFRKKKGALNDQVAPEFIEISSVGTKGVKNGASAKNGASTREGNYDAPKPAVSGFNNDDDSM
jgi:hypothetical protein